MKLNTRHAIIYEGNKIGEKVDCGHYVLIRQDNKIGDNVSIGSYTEIAHHVIIEDNVRIHSKCFIPEFSILRKGCWLGPCVCLVNARYPQSIYSHRTAALIDQGAIIGANSTILAGVHIGKDSIIGAGSVVTKDVPAGEVWYGNPAERKKLKKDLDAYG